MTNIVTIGIPFRSEAVELAIAIASVKQQTTTSWKLVLVADGASACAVRLAESMCDEHTTLWNDGERRGLANRLNELCRRCETPYIARMDADDIMHPYRLERQLDYLDQNAEMQLVGSGAYVIDEQNLIYGTRQLKPLEDNARSVVRNDFLIHPSILGRASWFRRNAYDETFERCQDKELWCRTWRPGQAARLVEPLMFYRSPRRIIWSVYSVSCAADRRLLRMHGPQLVGKRATLGRNVGSVGKQVLVWGAIRVGRDKKLVLRRSDDLASGDCEAAQRLLEGLVARGRELAAPILGLGKC